jgi:hypothetical protein
MRSSGSGLKTTFSSREIYTLNEYDRLVATEANCEPAQF